MATHSESHRRDSSHGRRDLRQVPGYVPWFIGDSFTEFGRAISVITVPLLALAVTGSPMMAGIIQGVVTLAALLVRVPAGMVVDTVDRRKIVYLMTSLAAVSYGALALGLEVGLVNTASLIPLLVFAGITLAISNAAVNAILKSILPPQLFPYASSLEEGRDAAASLAGAPVGGFLFAFSQSIPFALTALGNIVTIVSIKLIPQDLHPTRDESEKRSKLEPQGEQVGRLAGMLVGFKIVWGIAALPTLILAVTVGNLGFSGLFTTIVFSWQERGVVYALIGGLGTATGIGVIIGSFFAGSVASKVRAYPIATTALTLSSIGALGVSFSTGSVILTLAAFAVVVFPFPFLNAVLGAYSVASISNKYQGRAGAAAGLLGSAAAPLGPALAGVGVEFLGQFGAALAFAGFLAAGAIICWASPALRRVAAATEWGDEA